MLRRHLNRTLDTTTMNHNELYRYANRLKVTKFEMERNFDFDKLKGGQNYHTWQFAIKNFLSLKGLGDRIVHKPNKAATAASSTQPAGPEVVYADDVANEQDAQKRSQAKAYLVLAVDSSIYVHIQKCETALGVWNCRCI